ncbi:MAG: hypothetical protein ACP5L4_06825, partial [Thermoplasmata archaeon]
WISKKEKDGKVRHIPIQEGQRKRERQIKTKKQSIDEILKNLQWSEDTGYALSDAGEDEARIYNTYYAGYYLEVYPVSLVYSGDEGWEYRILNDEKGIDYNSLEYSNGFDHAKTPEEAEKWAIERLKEFLYEK